MPESQGEQSGARPVIDRLEHCVADALSRGGSVDPHGAQFLLRLYALTARDDLLDSTGLALAAGLRDFGAAASTVDRSAWLELFVEARPIADDDRLAAAIEALTTSLRADWTHARVGDAAAALDACLLAAGLDEHRALAAPAIDQLERLVGASYRPGSPIGSGGDQVRLAAALLTAFGVSGRLPYPMLAEELIVAARSDDASWDLASACGAARVLCRLAHLHDDADYRRAAVIAPGADYRRDAHVIIARHAAEADRLGAAGAIYGVALLELESSDLP